MKKLEIEYVGIDTIKPYKNNAKLHPREQIDQIKKSIEKFGMDDPIGVWNNEIVEGHGRLIACKELGFTEVPVIRLDHLTDEERKAYTLAHNKLTMNSDFDLDILNQELGSIQLIDMNDFGFELDIDTEELEVIEDGFDIENNIPDKPITQLGDIYQLGDHRLMCGDSTTAEDVDKLMDGKIADLVETDPPYNVNIGQGGGSICSMRIQHHRTDGATIRNDNMEDSCFYEFLQDMYQMIKEHIKPGGSFYIWHGDTQGLNFRLAMKEAGLKLRQCLIWNKDRLVMGRSDYQWKHEPCLYGWKDGNSHYFIDDRKQTTVFEDEKPDIKHMKKEEMRQLLEEIYSDKLSTTIMNEPRPSVSEEHPTMKPVRLIARQIKNSSRIGEIVLDLFGGAGSTLIACEQLDRKCYMMELDPHYVDVIVKRWETFTGKKAIKING